MEKRPLKIYPPLLNEIRFGLRQILEQHQPADKYLLTVSRNRKFGSRDRKFIFGHIYDIIRYQRFFKYITDQNSTVSIHVYDQWVMINTLRQHSEAPGADSLLPPDSTLLKDWTQLLLDESIPAVVRESYPDWVWELGISEYGDDWPGLAASLNSPALTYLRVNTLRSTPEEVVSRLAKNNIEATPVSDDALLLHGNHKLTNDPLYTKGHFEFQDLASQQVAIRSELHPGMLVVDACAGAGGKTLHAAALMRNEGKILASDKFPERLKQMEYRCQRAGVGNVSKVGQIGLLDYLGKADRVILDVPCSASGTIQRKPGIKWSIDREGLEELMSIQAGILQTYSELVNKDGKVVYATCSVFKCEGEDQVAKFLKEHPEFRLENEKRFYPAADRCDGFYIAVLSRN